MDLNNNNRNKLNVYVKYSALGFQMLAVIGLFAFIGYQIDKHRHSDTLLFTAIFGLIGVIGSLYSIINTLIKNK